MIARLAQWALSALGGKAGAVAVGACALLFMAMALTFRHLTGTIEDQADKIAQLNTALETEKVIRRKDVAGLTKLIEATASDKDMSKLDDLAKEYADETASPSSLSPYLRAYFECLHRQGAAGSCSEGGSADAVGN